jgi:hypothetical protein
MFNVNEGDVYRRQLADAAGLGKACRMPVLQKRQSCVTPTTVFQWAGERTQFLLKSERKRPDDNYTP